MQAKCQRNWFLKKYFLHQLFTDKENLKHIRLAFFRRCFGENDVSTKLGAIHCRAECYSAKTEEGNCCSSLLALVKRERKKRKLKILLQASPLQSPPTKPRKETAFLFLEAQNKVKNIIGLGSAALLK